MPIDTRSWKPALVSLVLAIASMGLGPSGDGAKVTKEQLEYSKQMFAEGEQAMAAGDYSTALAKYQEGYRYAPHLHVFTFNIASAADALDDCRTAQTYFQMFVDLVPKHPKLKDAKKRLATLKEECQYDAETETIAAAPPEDGESPEEGSNTQQSREKREANRAMNEALAELQLAQRTYEAAKSRYADVRQFGRAARRKKRHLKKLRKIAVELGVEIKDPGAKDIALADTAKRACREAESQEKRIAATIEKVLEIWEDNPKAYRVGNKILRAAERRDKLAFDACS